MNRIKTIVPLLILLVLAVAGATYAQQAGTKIAVVDSGKAFGNSIEGKRAVAQLQDLDTKVKGDITKMEDAIRLLENRLNTGRLTMTPEAIVALQADLDKKTTERKRYEEDQNREAQTLYQNLMQRIRGEMIAVIETLAKEKGLDLVLDASSPQSGVVTASPAIDITDEVVKRYDATKAAPAVPPVKK